MFPVRASRAYGGIINYQLYLAAKEASKLHSDTINKSYCLVE
jgi:hypothetical protein